MFRFVKLVIYWSKYKLILFLLKSKYWIYSKSNNDPYNTPVKLLLRKFNEITLELLSHITPK